MPAAVAHCGRGIGIGDWASQAGEPDVVMACAGDVPTLECMAAVELLRRHAPRLSVRVVNVVDLMTLESDMHHPHGMTDEDFEAIFTADKPVIFAFHGYPALIHSLVYTRSNARRFHVHGFNEEGTTTTPFDMVVRNRLDRFHLMLDAVERAAPDEASAMRELVTRRLAEHDRYIKDVGDDLPSIRDWRWAA